MVGRMQSEKDYGTYFDAIRLIAKNESNCRFIALGQGDQRESLLKQAGSLVESGVLIFPEPSLEVLPYLKKAHVGVLMTAKGIHEGISNAIMEYMACGLAVICSEGGGNSELVLNNETGYLIPVGDAVALADRLLHLRNDPQALERLGQAGRQRLLDNFSVGKMVQATLQIYEEIL
jgi:glycosyltransferase involved in cell wall biosynthesis